MQVVMVRIYQLHPAFTCSSMEISKLSATTGNCSGGRGGFPKEGLVRNTNLSILRNAGSLPILSSDRCAAVPREFLLTTVSPARLMDNERTPVLRELFLSMGLQRWIVGVFIASSVFVAPVGAAKAMLDSEFTTGPITEFLLSRQEQRARDDFSEKVSEAVGWLEKGRVAQARGDFSAALKCFDQVTEKAGDLALAEYARVGRAVTLYEVGDRKQAIIEMEDVSISLKGYPEIHAALAAALYADKNAPIPAEKQFTIATLLDPRYTDLVWVQETKHWPPSLLKSLQRFISLN